jgi:L-ascorbate metabolism protein UlaG (beta-lactamase superfamily)
VGACPRLTWIGHASFLLQVAGANVLFDPVFSERIGWFYQRHVAPGLSPERLPPIDVLLVSHSHYDHLDASSLRAAPQSATVVTGRGMGPLFCKHQFARIIELDWWDTVDIERNSFRSLDGPSAPGYERNEFRSTNAADVGDLQVTFVPARHWSRRSLFDADRTLWGGFVVQAGDVSIYFAGDTAWFDGFAEIGRRFPGLDAALLPIGGYEPAWFMSRNHLNPEQAGEAFLQTGARTLVPMHWGTFQMTDEPLREPIERLHHWWQSAAIPEERALAAPAVGETILLAPAPKSAGVNC